MIKGIYKLNNKTLNKIFTKYTLHPFIYHSYSVSNTLLCILTIHYFPYLLYLIIPFLPFVSLITHL